MFNQISFIAEQEEILDFIQEKSVDIYGVEAAGKGITTGEIMASLIITSIPIFIIYVAAQKYIVQGFGTAGLKM